MNDPDLTVNLAGIRLSSPITLLSGCVGFGEDLVRLGDFDFSLIGAIFLKGTTLEPRKGNPPPRIAETASGMLNAIGLQNPGARYVVNEILPRIEALPTQFIANIAGSSVAEYGEVARIFDDSSVAAIEINISCPNVKEGGAAFGSDARMAAQVVAQVRKSTSKPIITKLSPNVTDIGAIAKAVLEAGSDVISAINTLMGMAVDITARKAVLGNFQGGLSGPAIKPVALLKVWQVYQVAAPYGVPVIGQGGIESATDVLEFVIAGASAVGVGTALFKNPYCVNEISAGLHAFLTSTSTATIRELTGTLVSQS